MYVFYATIFFTVVYLKWFEVLDGDNQIIEWDKSVAEVRASLEEYKFTDLITTDNVLY